MAALTELALQMFDPAARGLVRSRNLNGLKKALYRRREFAVCSQAMMAEGGGDQNGSLYSKVDLSRVKSGVFVHG